MAPETLRAGPRDDAETRPEITKLGGSWCSDTANPEATQDDIAWSPADRRAGMSARTTVSFALHKAAEERTSKPGKRFATLTLHENVNSSTRWWRVVAFDEASIAAVLSLRVGEPIAVSGEINAELWAPEDGSEQRLSWKVTADTVLTARRLRQGRNDA
jgi:hypothetical protein